MEKQQIVQSILKAVETEVTEWVNIEQSIKDPMVYEQDLLERALRIGKVMLEHNGGKISKDRNQKKRF
jgi:hypothetical protein